MYLQVNRVSYSCLALTYFLHLYHCWVISISVPVVQSERVHGMVLPQNRNTASIRHFFAFCFGNLSTVALLLPSHTAVPLTMLKDVMSLSIDTLYISTVVVGSAAFEAMPYMYDKKGKVTDEQLQLVKWSPSV